MELFDIQHLMIFLNYKDIKTKYYDNIQYVKYRSLNNNKFGGFYIKEYIERNDVKHIVMNSRKIKMINLLEVINEPILYKLPIECETLKPISEIFSDYEPIVQYPIGTYYIDLYLKKVNIAIECDEHNHKKRDSMYEKKREIFIKENLNCKFVRYDPHSLNFNINNIIKNIVNLMMLTKN